MVLLMWYKKFERYFYSWPLQYTKRRSKGAPNEIATDGSDDGDISAEEWITRIGYDSRVCLNVGE